jgi:hypothetical protein
MKRHELHFPLAKLVTYINRAAKMRLSRLGKLTNLPWMKPQAATDL